MKQVGTVAEEVLPTVEAELGLHMPEGRVTLYVPGSMVPVPRAKMLDGRRISTSMTLSFPDGAITVVLLLKRARSDGQGLPALLAHELTHATLDANSPTYENIPRAVEEGIAEVIESRFSFSFMDLDRSASIDWESVLTMGQAAWLDLDAREEVRIRMALQLVIMRVGVSEALAGRVDAGVIQRELQEFRAQVHGQE